MATVNQGMSVEEIEQIVAQRVANAIEAIAIYETKNNMARESLNQTIHQEDEVARNASNKRKWEGDQNRRPNQQQNKEHKVIRAHAVGPNNRKEYVGSLPRRNNASFTTLACVQQGVTTASEGVTKQEIVGSQARRQNQGPQWQNRKLKSPNSEIGDRFILEVSPRKGVVRFGKWGKLNLRDTGPFKVLAKVGAIAYKFELPQELGRVHNTFHKVLFRRPIGRSDEWTSY
ncbi:hypothetical protein Tco_1335614 [Tanacetum coccineum]